MNPHALAAFLVLSLPAQEPSKQEPAKAQSAPTVDAKAGIEAWLSGDAKDRSACEKVSKDVIRMRRAGIELLASYLPKEGTPAPAAGDKRQKALDMLVQTYCKDMLLAQLSTNMLFAGQYAPMKALMPASGKAYLKFVLETPDWVNEELRLPSVSALRDVYPESPGESALNELRKVAKDKEFEREVLRNELAYALAQWGDRELVTEQITVLRKQIETAKDEDMLDARKAIADVYYKLREYDKAAGEWREWSAASTKGGKIMRPLDLYNAACSISLSGDVDGAIETIEKCLKVQAAGVDPSQQVKEDLFLHDPDLTNARKSKRFAEVLKAGFTKGAGKSDADSKKEIPEHKGESKK